MDNILDRADEIIRAFVACRANDGFECPMECPYFSKAGYNGCTALPKDVLSVIRALQSELAKVTAERDALKANAEPAQHGRWLPDGYGGYNCSGCGQFERWKPNYCCDCGSKMDLTEVENAD